MLCKNAVQTVSIDSDDINCLEKKNRRICSHELLQNKVLNTQGVKTAYDFTYNIPSHKFRKAQTQSVMTNLPENFEVTNKKSLYFQDNPIFCISNSSKLFDFSFNMASHSPEHLYVV